MSSFDKPEYDDEVPALPAHFSLAALLDDVAMFLGRFVSYPSTHARVAHALWILHCHGMEWWESTPRIAFLSPEPGSGKTRCLEVSELLVPRPVEAINATSAYLFRKVSDDDGLPTILFDEIDTLFGPKAKENEDVRGMLNAGHRRGAVAGRCVVRGKVIETEELPAYCAVAVAGLGNLPDTLLTRAVVVRMKRRAPGEVVEPYRRRVHKDEGWALRDRIAAWAAASDLSGSWPDMPSGIADRNADVWEALLMIADAAGDEVSILGGDGAKDWPTLTRVAAVALVADSMAGSPSLGIRLLADLRTIWDGEDGMHTDDILAALNRLEEAPWGELRGKPLDPRGLSKFLRGYGIHPGDVRRGTVVHKGYKRADLHDAWQRYLPPVKESPIGIAAKESATTATPATGLCDICGQPLDKALISAGFTTHGEEMTA
jgi:hypothetical protein